MYHFSMDLSFVSYRIVTFYYQLVKYMPATGDPGSIPRSGRSTGEGIGYPLQYSGPVNSMDCIVHGGHKKPNTTERLSLSL